MFSLNHPPPQTASWASMVVEKHTEDNTSIAAVCFRSLENTQPPGINVETPQNIAKENHRQRSLDVGHSKQGRCFYYDSPLLEEIGVGIPVSVPPMSESEHNEWSRGFCSNGNYFPNKDMWWNQFVEEDNGLTMSDVVLEILLVARGKVSALASGNVHECGISWLSSHLLEQAWKDMAQILTETNFGNTKEIIEAEPPKWLPDSSASACMYCSMHFHPVMCSRHRYRFCGGIFCSKCSKGRSLLPVTFRMGDPQRVCDVYCVRLESVQPYLMDHVSRASQLPTHDLTDLSTLRSWVNFPWGQSLEYEIYKATNTIWGYSKGAKGKSSYRGSAHKFLTNLHAWIS